MSSNSRFKFEDFRKRAKSGKGQSNVDERKPVPLSVIASLNAKLAGSLWKAFHKIPSRQDVFSSLSLSMLMAFVKFGASGKTSEEIASTFHFPEDEEVLLEGYVAMRESLLSDKNVEITTASAIFAPYGATFNQGSMMTGLLLGFKFLNVNFNMPELAMAEINGFVQQATNKHILNVVSAEDVDKKTSVVLLNTIHFKGEWRKGFSPEETKSKAFIGKVPSEVNMMSTQYRFPYAELKNLECRAVGLHYKGGRFMMIILLPHFPDYLPLLEESLEENTFVNIRQQLQVKHEIHVELPKIRIASKIELKPVFETIGIKSLFNKTAELDRMFENKDKVFVSTVVQQACIEISEEGDVEGDGSTKLPLNPDMGIGCVPPKDKVHATVFPKKEHVIPFHCHHSFLFYVYDNKYDSVLLTGICN